MIAIAQFSWKTQDRQHYVAIVAPTRSNPRTWVERIRDREHVVMKASSCGKWYIVPSAYNASSELRIGPFETPELAWSTLQLLKD